MHITEIGRQTMSIPSPDALDLSRTALLLDVDGTLLDIASKPADVDVPESLRVVLRDLIERSGGAVALVSGRTIETLDRLFSPLVAPAIGGHGAEMRIASDTAILKRSVVLGKSLRHSLHLLAQIDPHVLVEDKLHSIALHYRLAAGRESFLKREVSELVRDAREDVEFIFGKSVIDVKPKLFSKGIAVHELMTCEPFAGRTPIFIGDDTTDESAFAVMPELNGFAFSVGRQMNGVQGTFAGPEDVRSWLAKIWSQDGSRHE
jgi:trehalose 6-phosphate phosphatase